MTKKLLLAAAAAGVMAFAGAASAGSISQSSTVAGVPLVNTATTPAFGPFTIASEAVGPTAASGGAITGAAVIVNSMPTAGLSVANSVANTYEVVFTPSGGAFDGASSISVAGTDVVDTGVSPNVQYTQLGLRGDGTVAALVKVTGAGTAGATSSIVRSFTLNTTLKATSEADVKVAASVNLISEGVRIPVDSTTATTVAQFKPLLATKALAATPADVANTTAALPDYKGFKVSGATTPANNADLATAIKLVANDATAYAGGVFHAGFNTTAATIGTVVEGGTLTITGSAGAQLDKLVPSVGSNGTIVADTRTDTTVQFTIADDSNIEKATGLTLNLKQPATALALNAADYSVSFLPKFNTAYTAPTTAFGPIAAGSVALEGTNFTAPWFTLNNANNTAFLRLANNGTAATGPVFVTLKAHNGTTAPTTARVKVADSIASNGVFQITGPELATLFGSNAQNGDLQVTIQGDGNVISGKVRVRNATGALSEQSLGTLGGK